MIRKPLCAGMLVVLLCAATAWGTPQVTVEAAAAQTPGSRLITYAGTLTDAEGHARTGSVMLVFSLYAQQGILLHATGHVYRTKAFPHELLWRRIHWVAHLKLDTHTDNAPDVLMHDFCR